MKTFLVQEPENLDRLETRNLPKRRSARLQSKDLPTLPKPPVSPRRAIHPFHNDFEEEFFGIGSSTEEELFNSYSEQEESSFSPESSCIPESPSREVESPLFAVEDDTDIKDEPKHKDNVFLPFWSGFAGHGAARQSFVWWTIRWPFLLMVLLFITIDLYIYFGTRYCVALYENIFFWRGKRRQLRKELDEAKTYQEYVQAAKNLDQYLGNESWKLEDKCSFYDEQLIIRILRRLRRTRKLAATESSKEHTTELLKILKHSACKSNVGGIDSEALYSQNYYGTKKVVEDYFDEVIKSVHFVTDSPHLEPNVKIDFLRNAARVFGRTALCLSGGATVGYYHVGVVKALYESNLLPKVITGSSAAALVCCRTDEELEKEVFTPDLCEILTACSGTWSEWLKRLYEEGAIFSYEEWTEKMKVITKGTMTFLEAYKRTGRILNVPVVPFESYAGNGKMLNYITAPDVVISTAVMASSAIPNVLKPVTLLMKREDGSIVPYMGAGHKWRDGSIRSDIPEKELHQLFDVNYTIVSQTNPHILIFFYERTGSAGVPVAHRSGRGWRGGFLSSALTHHFKLDMQKWLLVLRDLSLLPKYQKTDVSDVFTQKFEGNVTITPPATIKDFYLLFSDPDHQRMQHFISGGEMRTWAKLPMIRHRMRLEMALKECRKKVGSGIRRTQSLASLPKPPSPEPNPRKSRRKSSKHKLHSPTLSIASHTYEGKFSVLTNLAE